MHKQDMASSAVKDITKSDSERIDCKLNDVSEIRERAMAIDKKIKNVNAMENIRAEMATGSGKACKIFSHLRYLRVEQVAELKEQIKNKKVELEKINAQEKEAEFLKIKAETLDQKNKELRALLQENEQKLENERLARVTRKAQVAKANRTDNVDDENIEMRCMVHTALYLGRQVRQHNLISRHYNLKMKEWGAIYPDLASESEHSDTNEDSEDEDKSALPSETKIEPDNSTNNYSPETKNPFTVDATNNYSPENKNLLFDGIQFEELQQKQHTDNECQTMLKGWKFPLKVTDPKKEMVSKPSQTLKISKKSIYIQTDMKESDMNAN